MLRFTPVVACLVLAACAKSPPGSDGAALDLHIAPLSLDGVTDASWTLTVTNAAGDTVWTQAGITASEFGDHVGSIAYVGPCDASSNPNRVTLVLDELDGPHGEIDPATYRNPTPLAQSATCREDADSEVDFDVTIIRDAQQGFFDVAVSFSDVFCSAKLDCRDALLPAADGTRMPTIVLAFACTSGPSQSTDLYLDEITVDCPGDAADGIAPRTYRIDPSEGPGNIRGYPPGIVQTATYFGAEQLPSLRKCYWNTSIGVDPDELGPGCVLHARGTASDTGFGAPPYHTPVNAIYPRIAWDVTLSTAAGNAACGAHPVDVAGSGVTTGYTDFDGERFTYRMACDDDPAPDAGGRMTCDAEIPAIGAVTVTADGGGVVVSANGHSVMYPALAADLSIDSCCSDHCCQEQ